MLSHLVASRFTLFSPTNQWCQWHWLWTLSLQGFLCLESSPTPLDMPLRLYFKAFCAEKKEFISRILRKHLWLEELRSPSEGLITKPATATSLSISHVAVDECERWTPNEPSTSLAAPRVCSMCWRCLCSGAGGCSAILKPRGSTWPASCAGEQASRVSLSIPIKIPFSPTSFSSTELKRQYH